MNYKDEESGKSSEVGGQPCRFSYLLMDGPEHVLDMLSAVAINEPREGFCPTDLAG